MAKKQKSIIDFSKIRNTNIIDTKDDDKVTLGVKVTYPKTLDKDINLDGEFISKVLSKCINSGELERFAKSVNENVVKRKQVTIPKAIHDEMKSIKEIYKITIQDQVSFALKHYFDNM